jgi:AAA15 family ATPase/GTPase
MFTAIQIRNFRGIKDIEIENLGKINIFVGDNATGKTAILDAVYILINPNNPELPIKTNFWRNLGPLTPSFWRSLFYDFDYNNEILIYAKNKDGNREVSIKPKTSLESMVISETKGNGELKADSQLEQKVSGLELNFKIDDTPYKSNIEQMAVNSSKFNIDNKYQEKLQGNYFNNNTFINDADFATKFDIVNQEIGKEIIIGFLKSFAKGIEDIELDRFRKLIVKDSEFGGKRVPLNTYGDGVIRGLHLLLDILSKSSGVTLIDEIENGLHWSKQEIVWSFIHKIIQERNQQLFVATHSKEMVEHLYQVAKKENFLKLIKVIRLQIVNGEIKVVEYDAEKLEFALIHGEEFR